MKRPTIDTAWIAERLKEPTVRRRKSDLAKALGVSNGSITSLLKGERQVRLSELPAISRLLRLSYDEIVRRSTGDPGYLPAPGWDRPEEAARIYRTTRDVLEALVRHAMSDMTPQEIDDYALLVSELTSQGGGGDPELQTDRLEVEVERLKGYRAIRRGDC